MSFHSFKQVTSRKQSLSRLTQGQREESEQVALSGVLKRQKKSGQKGSQIPGEIVRDFRRNNTLLFISGSPGWITEEESGFCLSAQGEVTTWEEVIVLRLGDPPVLEVPQCSSHIFAVVMVVFSSVCENSAATSMAG